MTSFLIEKKTPKQNKSTTKPKTNIPQNEYSPDPQKEKKVIIRLYNEGNNVLVYEFQHIQVIK